ncbi:unnamed protein product [Mytilus coruscus]|uniref:Endonuclease/exonuclease/phosphatase domain-containing protein n=1 Tax=Mytilus coruscus TaxID=42192 RepID=A0A6J8BYC2_MYTCO|nr:unnamed protein product [Mytilus coruscus]
MNNYIWLGNNRKQIHVRAKIGSGGVGILIKKEILKVLKVTIENDSEDGILWVKFTDMKNSSNMFYVCVIYLPPEFSARSVNAHNFFDVLMEQIYSIPKGNSFYLCGDFNSRLGNYTDFIQGIDQLSERNITDFTANGYGEIFSEFLSTVNCCVLNGRYPIHDDFTYVSTKGSSVVDYCVVPYESLCHYKSGTRNTKDKDQSSQTHNIVIKNLAVDPRENSCDTGAVLKAKVETLIKDGLKLTNVNINKAVRQVSLHRDMENTRKPNIIFVEIDNLDNKRAILKAKAVLRNTNKYRDVYIENNIPREKRMLDFNNRTILRAMGKDKEYRTVGGKITRLQNQTPSKYRDDSIRTQHNDNYKGNSGSFHGNTNKRGMNNGYGRGHIRGRECINELDLHIIGIAETHLINDNDICMNNYIWLGNNRKQIHVRAKIGSGGVGILIKKEILKVLKVTIENDSEDGILWVKFTDMKNSSNMFYVCVIYLPPEFSARSVNAHNFFDVLMEQIYSIPKGNSFYLCGDFNSRLGNYTDFIQGIDQLSERNITDFTANGYGEIFSEFLSTVNCCVLNGRYPIHDDFTYVSTKGSSVVDYCVVPYESLCHYKSGTRNTKDKDQSSQTHNIVIKNLAVDPRENSCDTGAVLKAKVETLIKDGLKLTNVNINKAVRQVSLHRDMENTRKPNIIFVEIDNLDNKRAILKAKAVLRNTNKYRDVYIENNIPREKRMLDFNNRTILRAMGKDKEYRTVGGKITRLQNQTPSKYRDDSIRTQHNDNYKGNSGSFHGNTNKRGMNNGYGRGHIRGRECINELDLHIIGIAETHLINDNDICMNNYIWLGNNRKQIHVRAKIGSGGVGILIKKEILKVLKVTIENDSEDGILWVKFTDMKNSSNMFYVCVIYLPPEFSARSVNAHNFFDVLMEQIYSIPKGNSFYLCGDFNSRLVRDEVRSEIDSLKDNFKKLDKSYAEIISNDRNTKDKDQSSQTHNIVIKNLAVDPRENSCDTGAVLKAKVETLIKDGLKLTNVNINKAVRQVSLHRDMENTRKPNIIFVEIDNLDNKRAILKAKAVLRNTNKYRDVYIENNIPREKRMLDFNNRTILRAMGKDKEYRTVGGKITRLQNQTPSKYRDDSIRTQHNDNYKGNSGSFHGNTNKRERDYVTCKQGSLKQQLRKHFVDKRKDFDKLTQKYKRQYWYRCQEELVNFSDNDPNQFWRRIGKNWYWQRETDAYSNEVTLDDGTITNNLETILSKWKSSFHSLLNPNVNAEYDKVENCNIKENIICIDLDKEITIDEVNKVVMNARNCKSAGIDLIQAELCKNISIISILQKLFNLCFSSGNVPNMWNKGIITPIPKCSTSDPRDPLSYRA